MSKFFDQTAKLRNLPSQGQVFDVAGLNETTAVEDQPETPAAETAELSHVVETTKKVDILHTKLLPTQFEGSEALKAAAESYLALRTRVMRACSARALKSVIVTSSIAGEGKTLTSFNLALCCSQLPDLKILLVDGDLRTGGLSRSLGFESLPGLAETLSGQWEPEAATLETNHPNLFLCPAGSSSTPAPELYSGSRWQEFMRWCTDSFSLVLVDSPPILSLADVELMSAACDGILWVVRARRTRRDVLRKAASQVDSKKIVGVVYNDSDSAPKTDYYSGAKGK